MRAEYALLAASVVLGLVSLCLQAYASTSTRGLKWGWGNREGTPPRELTGAALRLDLAFRNFLETFPFFAAAVLTAGEAGRFSTLSVAGAHLYFWGRLFYLPVYAAGILYWRTLFWFMATAGIFCVLCSLLV